MAVKIRKQIYIEPDQEAVLKQLTRKTGLSEAEFIRQAIEHLARLFQEAKPNLQAWADEKAFILNLIAAGSIPGGRGWRREDLYER